MDKRPYLGSRRCTVYKCSSLASLGEPCVANLASWWQLYNPHFSQWGGRPWWLTGERTSFIGAVKSVAVSASEALWSLSNSGNPSKGAALGGIWHLFLAFHVEGSRRKGEVKKNNSSRADTTQFNISSKISERNTNKERGMRRGEEEDSEPCI